MCISVIDTSIWTRGSLDVGVVHLHPSPTQTIQAAHTLPYDVTRSCGATPLVVLLTDSVA